MAASLRNNAKTTVSLTRFMLFDKTQGVFGNTGICHGHSWVVRVKPKKKQDFINIAPAAETSKTVKAPVEKVQIPDKIERSSTAVLEALASTVKNDVNQPMYISIDDPHLYATSDLKKKYNLAALDNGRKAAQMMISMYPDYFTQIWDDPVADVWKDKPQGYQNNAPSEEALLERIAKPHVGDAVEMYNALIKEKQPPSQKVQEKLLDLLTAYNSKNGEAFSDIETYIGRLPLLQNAPFPSCTWKKGNMAEQVFNSMPEKTANAYCSMLRGLAANYDKESALSLYSEMKSQNLPVDVYTYNKLLGIASLDSESMDDTIEVIKMILTDMAANDVAPDVETFNSALTNCRRLSRWAGSKKFALSLFSEMKSCGIEPNMSTFVTILNIFYYHKDNTSKTPDLFIDILKEVENKEFTCTSESDVYFFRTAMRVIATHFPDSKLALRVHELLKTGKNFDLLGHRQLVYGYFCDLFDVIIPLEHIDLVMDIYETVVPFIFTPTSEINKALLESIDMHESFHFLTPLYAELQNTFEFKKDEFIRAFARTMAKQKHEPQLQAQMCDIATSLIQKWQEQKLSRDPPVMNGYILGEFILVFLNNGNFKKARELYEMYRDDRLLRTADPSEESLTKLTEQFIANKDYQSTKELLTRMLDLGYESINSLVDQTVQTFQLSEQERNYLKGLADDVSSSSSSSSSDSD